MTTETYSPECAENSTEKLANIISQLQGMIGKHAFFDDLQENDPLVLPPARLNPNDPNELTLLWLHRSGGRRIPVYLLEDEPKGTNPVDLVTSADMRILTSDGVNSAVLSIWTNGYGIETPEGQPITDSDQLDEIAHTFQRYAEALDATGTAASEDSEMAIAV